MVSRRRRLAGAVLCLPRHHCRLAGLLFLMAAAGLSCSQVVDHVLQHLTVSVRSITVQVEHPDPPSLLLAMVIHNVNPGWIDVEHVDYVAYIDGREVYRGQLEGTDQQLRIDSRGRTAVSALVPITPKLLAELAMDAMRGPYQDRELMVTGRLRFNSPWGRAEHEFRTDNVLVELDEFVLRVRFPPFPQLIPKPAPDGELDVDI